ncbi:UDP-2,4-diacetamido-2,4,6-trideoxy-beta-L-altropyranose hydrolase [Niallia sp. 01092]|uniref:UDP-2,4-diacetamido-2,4, 6-trideoxy-beta-L-altropyranose hydrolase n=1 Tax=unclassified Niallia TaxID=2837522 RepID=UPI003FD1E389
MNVAFRVDASLQIGTGHVMRCITLAHQLKKININSYFICRELDGNLMSYIESQGFELLRLPYKNTTLSDLDWHRAYWSVDFDETKLMITKKKLKIAMIVVDHYALDFNWETAIKEIIPKIFVIDDLANRKHACDVLLDQNFYLNLESRYCQILHSNCRQLLGPNYVLLREEFLVQSKKQRSRDGEIRNILVFFGGADATNETMKTLKAISIDKFKHIDVNVVAGASNIKKEEIQLYCDGHPNLTFHYQISNMAHLMNQADLTIGAGGTTTWERCYLGLPSITITVADNQVEITDAVSNVGATVYLGNHNNVTVTMIQEQLHHLMKYPNKVKLLSDKALNMVDSSIVDKYTVLKAIMEEIDFERT